MSLRLHLRLHRSPWTLASALLRALVVWQLCVFSSLSGASHQPQSQLQAQADAWLRQGYDQPQPVLAALDAALATPQLEPAEARILQRTRGAVAARAGRDAELASALAALAALASAGDALARPDAALVRALAAEHQGRSALAVTQAREAADTYAAVCARGRQLRPDCDLRAMWWAQQTLLLREGDDAGLDAAIARGDEAVALAQRAGDPALEAWTLATQAALWAGKAEPVRVQRTLAMADALLRDAGRPDIEVRVAVLAAAAAHAVNDAPRLAQAMQAAFAAARRAKSPRLVAFVQAAQSDVLIRQGRAAQALAVVQAALPVVRQAGDRRVERVLLHNSVLASITLGQGREAKPEVERLFAMWASEGTPGDQSIALREVADALAAAGDARGALELYHREREVVSGVMASQRQAAELAARTRYDSDAQQRSLELKARDNAIQSTELHNRQLTQQLWTLAAVVVGLAVLVMGLLLRRVVATQSALQQSQSQLKVQSERDPLTGTTNRRHGQALLHAQGDAISGDWRGALLLVDVDHFKRVNDELGHQAGDQVLIEVARRLQQAVRGHDVVVRWGGEEFLVLAGSTHGVALDALAQRLMHAINATPVQLADGRSVSVTVSVGYGAFPLPPQHEAMNWTRALNLADMALYTAKSQGRNRAVGVAELAQDDTALADTERDFEHAWTAGRVRLTIAAGGRHDDQTVNAEPQALVEVR